MTADTSLARERCRNHGAREAVGRCPECRRFYCRECVTEHDDRLVCADCLRRVVAPAAPRRRRLRGAPLVETLLGLLVSWTLFYAVGRLLAELPTAAAEEQEAPVDSPE